MILMIKHKKRFVIIFAFVLVSISYHSIAVWANNLCVGGTCQNKDGPNYGGYCDRESDCLPPVGGASLPIQPVSSPPTQGLPTDLGQLIQTIFTWSLGILGISVFVMFFYSGFLWLTAAGNTSRIGDAKSHMTNAVFGAVLLLSSYLILYTINPDFVKNTFNLPGLGKNSPESGEAPSASTNSNQPLTCSVDSQPVQYAGIVSSAEDAVFAADPTMASSPNTPDNIAKFRDAVIAELKKDNESLIVGQISKTCAGGGTPGSDALIIGKDGDTYGEVCDLTAGTNAGETKTIQEVHHANCGEHTAWSRII